MIECPQTLKEMKFKWLQLDSNQNHLFRKRPVNHLAKLTKWLSSVLSTYPYRAFDFMFLLCHVRVSEWIHTP